MQSLNYATQPTVQESASIDSKQTNSLIYRGVPYEQGSTAAQMLCQRHRLIYRGIAYSTQLAPQAQSEKHLSYRGIRYRMVA